MTPYETFRRAEVAFGARRRFLQRPREGHDVAEVQTLLLNFFKVPS